MKRNNLFLVEFGKPIGANTSYTFPTKTLFVIANHYEEAISKAMIHHTESGEPTSVIMSDGSLNLGNTEVTISAVKLVSDNVII